MDNQESSTSKSSPLEQQAMDKIKDKQEKKRLMESSSESESEVEISGSSSIEQVNADLQSQRESENQDEMENKSLIEELPTEMMMAVLKYLNVKNLADCRLVSRRWNQVAREMIQPSDYDVEFCVFYPDMYYRSMRICEKNSRESLESFIKVFDDSTTSESPLYTRFRFYYMTAAVFDDADWLKFISDFGPRVKSLKLVMRNYCEREDEKYPPESASKDAEMMKLAGKLGFLLLNQLPNLQEFGLQFPRQYTSYPDPRGIQLFPSSTTLLPHLKTIYIHEDSFTQHPGILTHLIFPAAVNLQNVELFAKNMPYKSAKTFQALHSLGKLDLLQSALIRLDRNFDFKTQGSAPSAFKLKKLNLYVSPVKESIPIWPPAADFLSNLFESSKDTLTELIMNPIGFLPGLQLAKFSKLARVCIYERDEGQFRFWGEKTLLFDQRLQVLPSRLNLSQVFPVLQFLELQVPWILFFPHEERKSSIPQLKTLEITGREMTEQDISRISQVCPNLKNFIIGTCNYRDQVQNFPEVGTAIWTHLKSLQSLELHICVDSTENSDQAVNSCITGISKQECGRLYSLIKAQVLLKTAGSQAKIPDSEWETERKSPSILDLKGLTSLRIHLWSVKTEDGKNPVGPTKMLIVSEKCAFQLMENLKYQIHKKF